MTQKLSTIRKQLRCKVGDKMQLYTGQRTKVCRKLRDVVCIGTAKVVISEPCHWYFDEIHGDINPNRQQLFEQEGFTSAGAMINFFKTFYSLPFVGWLHAWRPSCRK